MATCPKGHDSTTPDYCDVCGALIAGTSQSSPSTSAGVGVGPRASTADLLFQNTPPDTAPEDAPAACPLCGSPQTGRFCELDGYDFVAAALNPPAGSAAPAGSDQPPAGSDQPPAGGPADQPPSEPRWQVVVNADQAYFEKVKDAGGPDAAWLLLPQFIPGRRFSLSGNRILIGRRSRSRGIHPEIDLAGPPEDPGVSHSHALLVNQPGSGWAVVDLGSSNGTFVNNTSDPIAANVPVPLHDGDRVYVGAWTSLTVTLIRPGDGA